MTKLPLQSPNLVSQNIQRIAALFPNCITETTDAISGELHQTIDFDLLKQELNPNIVDGLKERYRLEWAGKREAIVTANLPTTKTLRPIKADSVNFDTTQNLYIEGDNLEALKLLQESYLAKVKMIYIDPPYNTGNDFVYKDNFTQSKEDFEQENALKDEYNQRLQSNPETSGRYHSDWLTMMYPRLKLARNLLTDDGVIFISIDDNEVHNLRKICDEVFGEGNFIGDLVWQKRKGGGNDSQFLAVDHEFILIYCKDMNSQMGSWRVAYEGVYLKRYKEIDSIGRYYWDTLSRKGLNNPIIYDVVCPDGTIIENGTWQISKQSFEDGLISGEIKIEQNKAEGWTVFRKVRMPEGRVFRSITSDESNKDSSDELTNLFSSKIFSTPKPIGLLVKLIHLSQANENSIILDFFSGSATTAHAVMQLNAEDGGNRKFIMVQVPEATDEKSEAFKAGYATICEIGKERIRRAAKKIQEEQTAKQATAAGQIDFSNPENQPNPTNQGSDFGFRVYRLYSSNMQDVYYKPQDYKQENLQLFASNIKPDRTPEDLLAQVMLSWGLPLHYKIETLTIQGKQVFKVEQDSLFACFSTGIDEAFAKEIATHHPLRIVFKDDSFKDDTAKENVKQLLKQLSSNTEMKVI